MLPATAKLFHNFAPLQTPIFVSAKPHEAGHNVALKHSADTPLAGRSRVELISRTQNEQKRPPGYGREGVSSQ